MGSSSPPAHTPPLDAAGFIPQKKMILCNAQQPMQDHDKISALPDDILVKILSLMSVREAAVTDCLSKRWRHLWANVDHLILDMHTFGMQVPANSNLSENPDFWMSEATKFVQNVNELLHRHDDNGVKKIGIQFPLNSAHASELDRWVAFAVASHAENLFLYLYNRVTSKVTEPYVFPLKYFADVRDCQLRRLSLQHCILEPAPPNLSGFSHLDYLLLSYVRAVDEDILNIMSSCHALRYLYLIRCDKLIYLRISHAQLVAVEVYKCSRVRSISVRTEKLESFSYMGRQMHIEYECAPVILDLSAYFVYGYKFPSVCLGAFPKLEILRLQFPHISRILQHNGIYAGLREILLCILTSWKKSIRFVACLLKAAPLVKTLQLEVHGNLRPPNELKIRWPKNFTPTRLRTIKIGGFSGESELMQLLLFLLNMSPMLETLRIDTHPWNYVGFKRWKRRTWKMLRGAIMQERLRGRTWLLKFHLP
ncbi:hypothetical protein EJB05_14634 [Eragrostis curvula]|uniref:F-box domain-containing protein n=1 Tax=Eragrostis curvula TaxID=38414 RepID=A0A5J9VZ08_9POAL|nr:hypothetical protein EJB05_14634 [Eragrostis curvula]